MSTNMYKKYTESKTREWPVATATQAGTVVLHPLSSQVGVTLTARGDSTVTQTLPSGETVTFANGGTGNKPNAATVAVDGSWLLSVVGTVAGDTNPATGTAGTPSGTSVYRTTATGVITLTATDGVQIGVVDDGVIVGTLTPVLIGDNL